MKGEMSDFRVPAIAPKTYSGLLDDVVERYPISSAVDKDFFSKAIVKNLLFSGDVFINDGYLINHPASRGQLVDEDSILRVMMREGFVRVLSRIPDRDSFLTYPRKMAESGSESFQKTLALPDWPSVEGAMRSISTLLFGRGFVQPWPNRKMHLGFHLLISRIFDKTSEDLGLVHAKDVVLSILKESYLSRHPEDGNPRNAFELAVEDSVKHCLIPRLAAVELMNIANQAYHYNFAMCLSDDLKEPVVADTSVGLAFEDLLDLDDAVEAELLDIPLLDFPVASLSRKGGDYAKLLDPSSSIGEAKNTFLVALDNVFRSGKGATVDRRKDVKEASEQYRAKLAEHFAGRGFSIRPDNFMGNRMEAAITLGFDAIGGAVGVANYAGLAIGILVDPYKKKFEEFLLKPFREKMSIVSLSPDGDDNDKYIRLRLRDVRPRFASMAFNPEKVKSHVSEIPRMFDPK